MSDPTTPTPTPATRQRRIPPKPKRSKRSQLMIAVSLLLSLCILSWTFSLPFRTKPSPNELKNQRLNLAETIRQKRTRAEEIRDQAIADHQRMVRLVKQQRSTAPKPGLREARKQWDRKRNKIQKRLQALGNPKEGSIEWIEKQRLLSEVDDGPG